MAGLDILGGLGKGLMQGSQFVQQKNTQDEQLALQKQQAEQTKQFNDARLSMLQEEQTWQRQDRASKAAEVERQRKMNDIYSSTWGEMGEDADPVAVGAEVFRRSAASGLATQKELEPLLASVKELRARGINGAMLAGGGPELDRVLSTQFGRPVRVGQAPGKDEFGRPTNLFVIRDATGTVLKQLTPMQVGSMVGADQFIEQEERRLKMEELRSKSLENEAQAFAARASAGASGALADKYAAQTKGQTLENEGLAALPPVERTKSKPGETQPANVREAEWLRTATPEQRAAYYQVKKIGAEPDIAKEAVRLLTNSVRPITPEQAVAQVRQVYQNAGAQAVQVRSPDEARQLPPGTVFQTPDGKTMRVPAR